MTNLILDFIVNITGYVLIWVAVFYGRKDPTEIKLFSKNWWAIFLLIWAGTELVQINI